MRQIIKNMVYSIPNKTLRIQNIWQIQCRTHCKIYWLLLFPMIIVRNYLKINCSTVKNFYVYKLLGQDDHLKVSKVTFKAQCRHVHYANICAQNCVAGVVVSSKMGFSENLGLPLFNIINYLKYLQNSICSLHTIILSIYNWKSSNVFTFSKLFRASIIRNAYEKIIRIEYGRWRYRIKLSFTFYCLNSYFLNVYSSSDFT